MIRKLATLCAILGIAAALMALVSCDTSNASVAQQASQATYTSRIAIPSSIPDLIGVSIQGTRFYSQGRPITLLGVNRSSLEYSCAGDGHFTLSDFQAMRKWGMNAVRIPISSEFWANAGGSCPGYHETLQQAVAGARAAHLFVILDLQWSAPFDLPADRAHGGVQCPMPDTGKDASMWQEVAKLYHNDTGVLFDLFGEPFDVSWSTWLNGGVITGGCYIIGGPTLTKEAGKYQAIGMRALVQLVRANAPDSVIIVSGTSWGYDLSGLDSGFALADKNIAYDTHPFDYSNKQPSDWYRAFGHASTRYAVIAAEFGSYDCGTHYNDQAISYFVTHQISWLAWAWQPGPCSGPSLLADWSGAPSVPYGAYIRAQMLALANGG
jgi:endoglucanase